MNDRDFLDVIKNSRAQTYANVTCIIFRLLIGEQDIWKTKTVGNFRNALGLFQ